MVHCYDLEMFSVGMVHCYIVELDHLLIVLDTDPLIDAMESWNILRVVQCWAEAIHFVCHTGVVNGVSVCHQNSCKGLGNTQQIQNNT